MASKSLPVVYDLTVYAGATFMQQFRWLPDGSTPQDFTGWEASMLIGRGQGTAVLANVPTLTAIGQVIIRIPYGLTAALDAGTYAYNVDLSDPDGNVIRFLRGAVRVIRDVSPA